MSADDGLITVPHNRKAEEMIIGCILVDNSLIRKCQLAVDDFYFDKHQMYYAMFLGLNEDREPIDLVIMSQTLSPEDLSTLNGFMTDAFTTANFSFYENMIKELSVKRKLQRLGISIARSGDMSVDEIVTKIRNQVGDILAGRGASLVSMASVADEIKSFVDRRRNHAGKLSGLSLGLKDLDEFTDGLQNGDLIVLAGRPGTGKSAFAAHVAQTTAFNGIPVGFISMEMGTHQLGIRSLSSISQVEMWKLRKGIWADGTYGRVLEGLAEMKRLPIWFSFSSSDSRNIEKTITSMVDEKECKLIILDYLQLARSANADSREREVAQISSVLKNAARMNNIPVIALSQLNRSPEKEKRRPILADLRESGAIEQDADVVIFLHHGEQQGTVEAIFAKGRNIGTTTLTIIWNDDTMSYKDYQRVAENE